MKYFFANYFSIYSYKMTIFGCLLISIISFLLFIYQASIRNFQTLVFSRLILGLGSSRIPANRNQSTHLPSKLVSKYSFLGIAFLSLVSYFVLLIGLAIKSIVKKHDISDSFFDFNCYSGIIFTGDVFSTIAK